MENQNNPIVKNLVSYERKFFYLKFAVLSVISVVFLFFSGHYSDGLVRSITQSDFSNLAIYLVMAVLGLSAFSLLVAFTDRQAFLGWVAALTGGLMAVGFLNFDFSLRSVVAILLSALFFWWIASQARKAMENVLKVNFFNIAKPIINKVLLVMAALIAISLLNVFIEKPLDRDNPFLPESFFENNLRIAFKFIGNSFGEINPQMSLNQIIGGIISKEFSDQTLPEAIKEMAVSKYIDSYQEKIVSVFGTKIDPNQKISSALYQLVINRINGFDPAVRTLIWVGLAALLFLIMMAFIPIISWVVAIIALLLFELLVVFGFASVVLENRAKEVIILQ